VRKSVFDTWQDIATRLRASEPDRGLMLKGAIVIEALAEELKAPELCVDEGCPHHGTPHVCVSRTQDLHGPFGHLVIAVGLNEEHWRLSDEPVNDADHVSLPVFTKVDPFNYLPEDVSRPASLASDASPRGEATQAEREAAKSAFREWWDREQACPEHSMTTQNAAQAAWQEAYRVYRDAHPAPATVEMREAIKVLIADMRSHVDANDETAMILPRAQFNRYVGRLARIAARAPATEGRKG